jgi:hypothetical protein
VFSWRSNLGARQPEIGDPSCMGVSENSVGPQAESDDPTCEPCDAGHSEDRAIDGTFSRHRIGGAGVMSTSANRKVVLLSRRARLRGLVGRGGDGHELECNTVKEAQVPQPIKYQRANETKRAKREAATNERLKPRILPNDYFDRTLAGGALPPKVGAAAAAGALGKDQ